MKRILFGLALVLLAEVVFADTTAVLSGLKGKVEVKPLGKSWVAAKDGMKVDLLTTISTGFDSQATLTINENRIAVAPLTRLTVDKIVEQAGKLGTSLHLRVGKVSAEVKTSTGIAQDFKVTSPYSTASVRGTVFDYDGFALDVQDGTVAFIPGKPAREIVAGPSTRQRGDQAAPADESEAADEDGSEAFADDETPSETPAEAEPMDYGLADFLAALEAEFPDDNFDLVDETGASLDQTPPPTALPEAGALPPAGQGPTIPAGAAGGEAGDDEASGEDPTAEEAGETPQTPPAPASTPPETPILVGSGASALIVFDYSAPTPSTPSGGSPAAPASGVSQTSSSGVTTTTQTGSGSTGPTEPTEPTTPPPPPPPAPTTGKIILKWR